MCLTVLFVFVLMLDPHVTVSASNEAETVIGHRFDRS